MQRAFREHSAELLPNLKRQHNLGKNKIHKRLNKSIMVRILEVCVAVHFTDFEDDNYRYRLQNL